MPAWCSDCGKPAVGTFDVPFNDKDGEPIDLRAKAATTPLNDSERSSIDRPLCAACSSRRPGTVLVTPKPATPSSGSTP